MPTIIDNDPSGVFTQISNNDVTVTTQDSNKDGLIDAVKVENRGSPSTNDGWLDATTTEGLNQINQILQNMGLGIVSDGQGAELVAELDQPLQLVFDDITKKVGSGLVMQSGSANNYADVQGQWADFISKTNITGEVDVNMLVQQVLREAYMQNTEDLQFYAHKVKFFNELKDQIRERLVEMREVMGKQAGNDDDANLVGGALTRQMFDSTPVWDQDQGRYIPGEPITQEVDNDGGVINTKGELDAYITNLEEQLNSIGDDAQLANVDLQNMLQKQQQTLQMMSNISKMLHDTAMAVIRKIGG